MKNPKKYKALHDKFYRPLYNLYETYDCSAFSVENGIRDAKVVNQFKELLTALTNQLNTYK